QADCGGAPAPWLGDRADQGEPLHHALAGRHEGDDPRPWKSRSAGRDSRHHPQEYRAHQGGTVMSSYTVVLLAEEDGRYSASVPALPGAVSWGDTVEDALANVTEAI